MGPLEDLLELGAHALLPHRPLLELEGVLVVRALQGLLEVGAQVLLLPHAVLELQLELVVGPLEDLLELGPHAVLEHHALLELPVRALQLGVGARQLVLARVAQLGLLELALGQLRPRVRQLLLHGLTPPGLVVQPLLELEARLQQLLVGPGAELFLVLERLHELALAVRQLLLEVVLNLARPELRLDQARLIGGDLRLEAGHDLGVAAGLPRGAEGGEVGLELGPPGGLAGGGGLELAVHGGDRAVELGLQRARLDRPLGQRELAPPHELLELARLAVRPLLFCEAGRQLAFHRAQVLHLGAQVVELVELVALALRLRRVRAQVLACFQ